MQRFDPWRHPAERRICLGLLSPPSSFNIPTGNVDCVRLWCLTVSCGSAQEDVAAQPFEAVTVLALLTLLLLSRRSTPWWRSLLVVGLVVVVVPFGHALWRAVWIPCAAVCEDNDANQLRACEASWLPPLLQLQMRVALSQDAAAWGRSALAVLEKLPETHEHDCVIKQLACNHGPSVPSVVYPSLNAIYEDACVALDGNGLVGQSTVFAPTERMAGRSARCRAEPGSLLEHPIATCQPVATAMMYPCQDWRTMRSGRTRFCKQPLPMRAMHASLVHHGPLLFVEQSEAAMHPGNIGHFFRDVSFVATMLHEARRDGSMVYAPLPPDHYGQEVLGPWQRALVSTIWRPGGAHPAASLIDALRAVAAHRQDHTDNSSRSAGGGHVCGRRVQRFDNAFGVAHAQAAMDEVTQRVHAHCSKSLERNKTSVATASAHPHGGRRTLLLSFRSGPNRLTSNVDEALDHIRRTARALGLEARAVNFGQLSFCEQAMEAATALVLIGAHGADLANAFLMPGDSTLVEAVPKFAGDRGIWHTTTSSPAYGYQMAALGRRYLSVRLYDVDNASHCGSSAAWMYGSCSARINPSRLNATLEIVRRLYQDAGTFP